MIRDLTPASQRSPLHASTMSLAGTLLCLFTTFAVLIIATHDQSGADLSEVTAAFNGSLHDHGREDLAVIAAGFRQTIHEPTRELAEKSQTISSASRQKLLREASPRVPEEDESGQFRTDQKLPVDVNGPVFSHLVTELERYCDISSSVEFDGQLALDLHSQSQQSDIAIRNAIERTLKTCWKANGPRNEQPSEFEFEIVIWASTPASDALANATDKAFDLEQSLQKSLKANKTGLTQLSSSGRIWTRPNSPRPLATILIRTASR
jgi:hypothetical protein